MLPFVSAAVALLAIPLPAASGQPAVLPDNIIVSFLDDREPERWITVNDNVMGGRSSGGPAFADGLLTFSGRTNTNGGGFSSIRTREQAWDLGESDGLLLRVRGDGRSYIAALTTDTRIAGSSVSYWQTFDTTTDGAWTNIRLPFDAFVPTMRGVDLTGRVAPLDPARASTIGLYIYDKKDGPFRIDVAWIGTYTAAGVVPSEADQAPAGPVADRAIAAFELAITRGVPRFNAGDHGACADIYETALTMLLATGGQLSPEAAAAIEQGLTAGKQANTQADRAWAYRRAIDEASRILANHDAAATLGSNQ